MIYNKDCLEQLKLLENESVNCCVTSPPYWGLRDYNVQGQLGLEKNPDEYVKKIVEIFREVRRVLKKDGTLWLNLGDSYAGSGKGRLSTGEHSSLGKIQRSNQGSIEGNIQKSIIPEFLKPKDLIGIPWRVAFALQKDGWYLRQDIIWHKPNPMPESVRDRCTKAHEYIFLLSKSSNYYFDQDAIREPYSWPQGRLKGTRGEQGYSSARGFDRDNSGGFPQRHSGKNKRSVWSITPKPFKAAHFATYPPDLIRPCILAGCPIGGIVIDPFFGSGTTGVVALQNGRKFIGIELNSEYISIAEKRLNALC
jgi:DNA modification methylase